LLLAGLVGAGIPNVETCVAPRAIFLQLTASMEPRPSERGNSDRANRAKCNSNHRQRASMEPRPSERGNASRSSRIQNPISRFNGATSFRTWKLWP